MGKKWGVDSGKGALLIEERLGVPCSRQSLDYHLRSGKLTECVRSSKPWKLDPDILLEEYQQKVKKQAKTRVLDENGVARHIDGGLPRDGQKPRRGPGRPRKNPPTPPEPQGPAFGDPAATHTGLVRPAKGSKVIPNLHQSINAAKAWGELEKARKLQVERLAAEGEYVRVSDIKPTWEKAFLAIQRGLMGVPSKVKAENPEASFELIDCIRNECRDVLHKAFSDLMDIEPDPDQLTEEERLFDLPDEGDMQFEA
jgi:hypothetical protein